MAVSCEYGDIYYSWPCLRSLRLGEMGFLWGYRSKEKGVLFCIEVEVQVTELFATEASSASQSKCISVGSVCFGGTFVHALGSFRTVYQPRGRALN
jgi:hypothetical protein